MNTPIAVLLIKRWRDRLSRDQDEARRRAELESPGRRPSTMSRGRPASTHVPSQPEIITISPEQQALIDEIKRMTIDDLIKRASARDIMEVFGRTKDGKPELTAEQLDSLSTIEDQFAEFCFDRAASLGTPLTEKVISRLCKSDSASAHIILATAKRKKEQTNPGTAFLSDQQLLDLSTSKGRTATKMVYEILSEDCEARHNLEPRNNPNDKIVVHSKTVELRPGTESTVFAASIESSSGDKTFLTSRDPLELVLGIDNVLKNSHQFSSDPNAQKGIANSPYASDLFTQLRAVQSIGLA